MDMAVLVEAQGEILDNIESQVCFCTLNLFGWVVFLCAHMFVEGHILFGCVC